MKIHMKIQGSLLLCIIGIIIAISVSCSNLVNSSSSYISNNSVSEQLTQKFKKPKGNELEIAVKSAEAGSVTFELSNQTSEDVFVRFFPHPKTQRAYYIIFEQDKYDLQTGTYKNYNLLGHLIPPLTPIRPKNKLIFTEKYHDKGKFKLRIGYLIDSNLAKRLNEKEEFPLTDEEKTENQLAWSSVESEPFDVK